MTDSVVKAVVEKFLQRSELGQKKYGTTLDRTDLGTLEWINHAQEEFMDGILYLERLKRCFQPLRNEIVDDRPPSPPSSSESEGHDNSDSEMPVHPAENFIIIGGKKRPRPENYSDVQPMKKRAKQQKSVSTESRHSVPSLSSESAKSEQVLKSCAAQARRCGEKL